MHTKRFSALLLAIIFLANALFSSELKNDDIIKLINAGLSEETILTTINSSDCKFDTGVDSILELKEAGVSETVIQTMLMASDSTRSTAEKTPSKESVSIPQDFVDSGILSVILENTEGSHNIPYVNPRTRAKARALGLGGSAIYLVLPGPASKLRTEGHELNFVVPVPTNSSPESNVTLTRWEPRRNGTREILVAGGFMSLSEGFPKERIMPVEFSKMTNQSRAPRGYTLFEMRTRTSLEPGEYAVVVTSSGPSAMGAMMGTSAAICFDFGVH